MSWPEPLTRAPSAGITGRISVIESSAVVIPCPASTSACTTEPSAASPITARTPPEISPEELANHGEAGIVNVEWPRDASVSRSSVRYDMGELGIRPRRPALTRSMPDRPRNERSGYPPLAGSCQITSPTYSAATNPAAGSGPGGLGRGARRLRPRFALEADVRQQTIEPSW